MYLVSACLAGFNCRYDGSNKYNKEIVNLIKQGRAVPVCPEIMGGLPTPRNSVEITQKNGSINVVDKNGNDFTDEFCKGAEECLKIAKILGCNKAILKTKSPSCGFGEIYDGTFSGKLRKGNGITAQLLSQNNIRILNQDNYLDNE